MNVRLAIAYVLAFAIAGCSAGQPNACKPPREYWRKPHNFAGLMPPLNKVSLTPDGNIYWNGERISEPKLAEYLAVSHTLNPEPEVLLETEMGVPCGTVERVRDKFDEALECKKQYNHCSEGIETVWRNLPTPPGTPVS